MQAYLADTADTDLADEDAYLIDRALGLDIVDPEDHPPSTILG